MKKQLLIILLLNSLLAYSQTTIPIKFKVTENADVQIGKDWDFSYTPLNTPINVNFDGKVFKMIYETGKVYFESPVISYEQKQKKVSVGMKKDLTILKINDHGYIQYIIIEYTYTISSEDNHFTLMKPTILDDGLVFGYWYFQ
jgi:hypothetical protein